MTSIGKFIKATFVGGIFFLLPITILIFLLGKAFRIARDIITPIASDLPISKIAGIETARLLTIVILILLCFFVGLFSRSLAARKSVTWLEDNFLMRFPGYILLKSVGESALGSHSGKDLQPILAHIEETWQFGLYVESLNDGRVVVFIPEAPDANSGDVLVLEAEKIQKLNIQSNKLHKLIRQIGVGSKDIMK
jgi:uncharacterized membrane protein